MNFLLWIIFGGVVGWIASIIMGTDARQGIFLNVVVGIIGAFLGGWIMTLFGQSSSTTFSWYGFFVALLGSVVLLFIVRMFRRA